MSAAPCLRGPNKKTGGIKAVDGIKTTDEIKIIDETIVTDGAIIAKKTKKIITNSLIFG